MSLTVYPDEYDSLMHFYETGSVDLVVDEQMFFKEDIDSFVKHDFKGIFTFVLMVSKYKRKFYDFVALNHYTYKGHYVAVIAPVKMEDEEFAQYFKDYEAEDNKEGYKNYWLYTSYNASAYQTNEYELVDFHGHVRPIEDGEIYVTDNDINYLVSDELLEPPVRTKEHLENLGYWKRMEEDQFMGKFVVRYGYNTGEIADDVYTISLVNEDRIFLEPCSLRNEYNTPNYVWYDGEEDNVTIVRSESTEFYIPYDGKEDITKTPCYTDIVDSYKTL